MLSSHPCPTFTSFVPTHLCVGTKVAIDKNFYLFFFNSNHSDSYSEMPSVVVEVFVAPVSVDINKGTLS